MSSGNDLQEMEVGTTQSKTAVNANAKPAEAPSKSATPVATPGQTGNWEDLGGPTPDNYKSDDDSAKLKTPGATLSQVRDVVNAKAKAAEAMKVSKEEVEAEEETISEEDSTEIVSEEEVSEETEEQVSPEFELLENQIEEDVNALLSGEELSEEFREKAKTIFEAALNTRLEQLEEAVVSHYETQYQEKLAEATSELAEELTERVDSYLEYVADEWIQENTIAVERGIQTQASESFLLGLKGLFEDHYVSIPEDKYDVLESMVDKLDEMESKLNEQIERNVNLNKRLAESTSDVIFSEVSEGLALSQKDKLASLAENVEFGSENDYREKLVTLRESYFPSNVVTQRNTQDYIAEEAIPEAPSGVMGTYLQTLERVSKK
jgi:hypothetical protein